MYIKTEIYIPPPFSSYFFSIKKFIIRRGCEQQWKNVQSFFRIQPLIFCNFVFFMTKSFRENYAYFLPIGKNMHFTHVPLKV